MFKSVTYDGFDHAPELRAVCEGLTAALAAIRHWPHERMAIRWVLDRLDLPEAGGATIEFRITDGWTGTDRLRVAEALLRDRAEMLWLVKSMWMDMNSRFLDERVKGFNLPTVLGGVE